MIKLESLTSITSKQLEQLTEITNDIEVMKWVGTGELWSSSKIKKNITYLKTSPKDFMAWTIMNDMNVVGYLAITGHSNIQRDIRILIGRQYQGQGFATMALNLLIKKMSRESKSQMRLISYVKQDNIASNKIHVKAGFKLEGKITKYSNLFNKYSYIIKSGKLKSHKLTIKKISK
jgi:RimJ/RimL family protein N-acetyltransferase